MRFLPLDKLINLHDGYRRRIKIDALDVLLIQEAGEVFVVDSRCPHQEASLEQADLLDGMIYCPMHGFGFSLVNGQHDAGTWQALRVYPAVFEGAEVGITLADAG